MISKCTVEGTEIPRIAEAKIVSDCTASTDTASIIFPKLKANPSDFHEGQRIELFLGYSKYGLKSEFSGVIGEVSPRAPIELKCFDNFHLLRQRTLYRMFAGQTIEQILKEVVTDFPIVCDETPVVTTGCPGLTVRWFLLQLCRQYGFNAFFREGKLYFLKPGSTLLDEGEPPVFCEGENILEDNLSFHTPESVTQVVVLSETEYGFLIRAQYGTAATNVHTIHCEGLAWNDAYKRAEELYNELNYGGFRGSFKTLGYPYVRHSLTCNIDSKTEGKAGTYRIDKVETNFGTGGFRRIVYLGKRTGAWKSTTKRKRIFD
ncbi:MAG: hypothetical protein EPN93_17510 [Spirochaetes bacterium]|nr:MAG: hypothetical protein EPN93_17510 [Spirochaetota bacterium]